MNIPNDEIACCPYDPNHKFAKSKLFPHIQKCKAAKYTTKPLLFCKQNSATMFFEEDKPKHLMNCKFCSNDKENQNEQLNDTNKYIESKKKEILKEENMKSFNFDLNYTMDNNEQVSKLDLSQNEQFDSSFVEDLDIAHITESLSEKTKQDKSVLY